MARVTLFFRDCYRALDKAHSSYQWMDQLLKHFKWKQLSLYVTEAIQGKQLNHKIVLCWQEIFRYFTLIIIVERKYFLSFFLPLRLNLQRGRQTGFGKQVQRGLAEIKEVHR